MNISGLNTSTFPNLSAYLNALPSGLDSHPEAKTKGFYALSLREKIKADIASARLPQALRTRFLSDWGADDWIPASLFAGLVAFAKDVSWKTDVEFEQGMAAIAALMYQSPFYRGLMAIISPSLMAMGAAKRWSTFHQGTQLRITNQTKTSGDAVLTFPHHLFCKTALQCLGITLGAALSGCGAKNVKFALTDPSAKGATLRFSWDF